MTRADWIGLLLAILAVGLSALVGARTYENIPHLEDEIAYVWQGRVIADGRLTLPSPEHENSFLVPFVVDYEGQRFGKYPIGWPVVLSLGIRLGLRAWVNPLLAALAVWLIYRLGKRAFGELVGLLGAGLTVISPFFLLNTGSLLSHPLGLVLATAFIYFWLDLFTGDRQESVPAWQYWLKIVTLALVMGLFILSRPYTAVGIALPFAVHGLYLLLRGGRRVRLGLLVFSLLALSLASLHFLWQYAVTGDPLLNPYTLWWEYDQVGFGPGVGRMEGGHNLRQGWINTKFSLRAGYSDLFGWAMYSWILLPFGLLAIGRSVRGWLIAAGFPALLLVYLAYWVGSWLFGPRYYFESLQGLALITALGAAWLAGWPTRPDQPVRRFTSWKRLRPLLVTAGLALLVSANLIYYLPGRLQQMHNLYGIGQQRLEPFLSQSAQELEPALFIVHTPRWMPYGALLDLQSPDLQSEMIFAIGVGPNSDANLAADYPDRNIFHYYPDEPWKFYTYRQP